MVRKKKSNKRPRGNRGISSSPCLQNNNDNKKYTYYDLMIPLPKNNSTNTVRSSSQNNSYNDDNNDNVKNNNSNNIDNDEVECQLLLRQLLERCIYLGYKTIALTHTIYGRPNIHKDSITKIFFGDSIYEKIISSYSNKLNILKRLHAVIENSSDLSAYYNNNNIYTTTTAQTTQTTQLLLEEYDIVSISPRNDTVFQALCRSNNTGNSSSMMVDIITLDYTSGRGNIQLPFKIRTSDIKELLLSTSSNNTTIAAAAATSTQSQQQQQQQQQQQHPMALELCYSSAILNINQRKGLIQTCRDIQMSTLGHHPNHLPIIVSSGYRLHNNNTNGDVGSLALRSYGDLIDLLQTVCLFNRTISYNAVCSSCYNVLQNALLKRKRKGGNGNRQQQRQHTTTTTTTSTNDKNNNEIIFKINGNHELVTNDNSKNFDRDDEKKKKKTKKQKTTPTTTKSTTKDNNNINVSQKQTKQQRRQKQEENEEEEEEEKQQQQQEEISDHNDHMDDNDDDDDDIVEEDGYIRF